MCGKNPKAITLQKENWAFWEGKSPPLTLLDVMPSVEKSCSANNESPEIPALPVQHITNCISVVKSPNFPMSVLVLYYIFNIAAWPKNSQIFPKTLWIRPSKCIHPEVAHHRSQRYHQASKPQHVTTLLNWLILALDWNTWQQHSCFF